MGRSCDDCGYYCQSLEFISNQWRKGEDLSRCQDCVSGRRATFDCNQCEGRFSSQNARNQYSNDSRRVCYECAKCGRVFDATCACTCTVRDRWPVPFVGTLAFARERTLQHVESGYCRSCRGSDNARKQIYEFAVKQQGMRPFMCDVPHLEYGNGGSAGVPDTPYCCGECNRSFRQLVNSCNTKTKSTTIAAR